MKYHIWPLPIACFGLLFGCDNTSLDLANSACIENALGSMVVNSDRTAAYVTVQGNGDTLTRIEKNHSMVTDCLVEAGWDRDWTVEVRLTKTNQPVAPSDVAAVTFQHRQGVIQRMDSAGSSPANR